MLRKIYAGKNRFVSLTDDLKLAKDLREKEPVIFLQKPGQEAFLTGFSYIVMDEDALDPWFVQLVWSRFYKEPVTIAEVDDLVIRESSKADLPALQQLYKDPMCKRFLEVPAESKSEWDQWFLGYQERCTLDFPGFWTIAKGEHFLGRIGCYYRDDDPEGWCYGYALLPEYRGKGIIQNISPFVFKVLKEQFDVNELILICDSENRPSQKTAEALGFKKSENISRGLIYRTDLDSL